MEKMWERVSPTSICPYKKIGCVDVGSMRKIRTLILMYSVALQSWEINVVLKRMGCEKNNRHGAAAISIGIDRELVRNSTRAQKAQLRRKLCRLWELSIATDQIAQIIEDFFTALFKSAAPNANKSQIDNRTILNVGSETQEITCDQIRCLEKNEKRKILVLEKAILHQK
ncbi:hypothetical protein HUJ04_000465 [Dendroctonus ponderosae]|nr:hypothetical protein HUJ04_000465 [Dendroctonus ponderosae]